MNQEKKILLFCLLFFIFLSVPTQSHFIITDSSQYGTIVAFSPHEPPIEGENSLIQIFLQNTTSFQPFSNLDLVHDRIIHVFIIGGDLKTFAHIHPEDTNITEFENKFNSSTVYNSSYYGQLGYYFVNYTFPKAGKYEVVLDFTINGISVIKSLQITVRGNDTLSNPVLDFAREKVFSGYNVTLNVINNTAEVGKETELDYHIEKNGTPVNDLQLYLSSEIHVFLIRDDLTQPGHTHAFVPGHFLHIGNYTQKYFGPDLPVRWTFTQAGNYVIFGQFQENNTLVTTRFFLKVTDNNFPWIYLAILIFPVFALAFIFRRNLIGKLKRV